LNHSNRNLDTYYHNNNLGRFEQVLIIYLQANSKCAKHLKNRAQPAINNRLLLNLFSLSFMWAIFKLR